MKISALAKYNQFIIVGFGLEGKSSAMFLQKQFPEIPQKIIERIETPLKETSKSAYIISPGINRQTLLKNIDPQHCTSNTEIFFENISEENRKKVIGITGTKGKSTTTKFLYECLNNAKQKVAIGGNYGSPLLDHFDTLKTVDFLVAELSSYQLEFLQSSPFYSIFLNIFADHLDRHGTIEEYTTIKTRIFNTHKHAAYCFIPKISQTNLKKDHLWPLFKGANTNFIETLPVTKNIFSPNSVFGAKHFRENFGTVQSLLNLILPQAIATATLEKTAQAFIGLPHRSELFNTINEIKFYDDSISSNPDTAVAAINLFHENLGAIVLGGYSGGGTYDKAIKTLKNKASASFIWLPESNTRDEILLAAKNNHFPEQQIITGKNFSELLTKGFPLLKQGVSVILSPGAKSFDSFSNFKVRGAAWKNAVKKYKG